MTCVPDMDAGDEYFVPTASAHQRQAIKRVGSSRHETSTIHSYVELAIDDHAAREVPVYIGEVREDNLEVSVPETPVDPTFLTDYPTHIVALIWRHQVMFLRLKICTY